MSATTSTMASAIKTTYQPGFTEGVFRNNSLLSLFGSPITSPGDTAYRWIINTAGNSSVEIYSEGQAQKTIGNQSYATAAVSYLAFRFMVSVTGHARAALRANWFNALDSEMVAGQADLVDLITTTFMASTYGIEAAVAATGSYAGITRGSVPYFESSVTAVNAPLALSDLIDLQETIRDNDKGGQPSLLLCPLNQQSNIYRLAAPAGMKTMGYEDAAPSLTTQSFNGMPIVALPDWTDTVICMLDMRPDHWVLLEHQPYQVKDMAPSGDSDVWQISWMGILVGKQPRMDGKLTGVTA